MLRCFGRMLKHLVTSAVVPAACAALTCAALMSSHAYGQVQSPPGAEGPAIGKVIDRVPCASDSTETYALYVPSSYQAEKAWPIIYTFDPEARGDTPVHLYKDAAEKFGFILAASNNSRNFQNGSGMKAAQAVWEDTHRRLKIDPRRVYMMGFSGGARVATQMALVCENCNVAGVIAHGAGYPVSPHPSEKDHFAYFSFIGEQDFNWPEIMDLRRQKEEWGNPYRLRIFAGGHQWAPASVFDGALAWLQLKAMQNGSAPRDAAFIEQSLAATQKEAADALQRQDVIAQFEAYRSLATDFSGLKDVTEYQARLAALKNSPELKKAFKKLQAGVDRQHALTDAISAKLSQVADASLDTQAELRVQIVDAMTDLLSKAKRETDEETRLIYRRAVNDVWAQTVEAGQAELETKKHLDRAEFYFQILSMVTPNQPWPVLLLAETNALRGDKKRAMKDLHEAVKRGLNDAASISEDENLQTLRSEAEFQQVVAELKAKSASQSIR